MFHSDSRGRWIDRWDFDPATGAISNRKRIADLDEATGRPDGGATDAEGRLLERRRLGRAAQPLLAGGRSARILPGAGRRADHAVLRRSRLENAVRHQPARRPGAGTARPISADRHHHRRNSPVAGSPVTRFRDK